jgi:hypothetical protein
LFSFDDRVKLFLSCKRCIIPCKRELSDDGDEFVEELDALEEGGVFSMGLLGLSFTFFI